MRNLIEEYGYFVIAVIVASAVIVSIVLGVAVPQMSKYTQRYISGDYTGGTPGPDEPSGGNEKDPEAYTGNTYEYGDYIYKYDYKFEYANNIADSDWVKDATSSWGVCLKDITKEPSSKPLTTVSGRPVQPLAEPETGAVYEDDFYIYRYNMYYTNDRIATENLSQNGWGVRVKGRTNHYGDMCSYICGKPVNTLRFTFAYCTIQTAPVISSSATNMREAFANCECLTAAPVVPDGVTDMSYMFSNCTSLAVAPTIPEDVTDMSYAFNNCISLATAPKIPQSVINMSAAFFGCESLIKAPAIPYGVADMSSAFSGCTSLASAPVIPNSVTDMSATFSDCYDLTGAPAIPSSVTNMRETFFNCLSLTGVIEINANPTEYANCLTYTGITEITGSTTLKEEILATVSE